MKALIAIKKKQIELEEISEKGNAVDVRGKLVSISAEPVYEDRIVSIANMFWVSYIPYKRISVGG